MDVAVGPETGAAGGMGIAEAILTDQVDQFATVAGQAGGESEIVEALPQLRISRIIPDFRQCPLGQVAPPCGRPPSETPMTPGKELNDARMASRYNTSPAIPEVYGSTWLIDSFSAPMRPHKSIRAVRSPMFRFMATNETPKPGRRQSFDPFGGQESAVADQFKARGNTPPPLDHRDDFGVMQGFAVTTEENLGGVGKFPNPIENTTKNPLVHEPVSGLPILAHAGPASEVAAVGGLDVEAPQPVGMSEFRFRVAGQIHPPALSLQ